MNRVKRSITILSLIAFFMLILSLITVHTVKADAGMLVVLLLFFVVHPIISICVGILAGKDIKFFWPTPIILAVLFWLFSRITYEPAFPIVYSAGYLTLSSISMVITWLAKKKKLR